MSSTTESRKNWLRKEFKLAFLAASKGKKSREDVQFFTENYKTEIESLIQEIFNRTYKLKPSTVFIINKPVKREIFAADFRDRIVHHFLFNQVSGWWDRRFIEDSYSCRVGKGTLYGIKRLNKHIRAESDCYTKEAYLLKLDLQGYFMSLNRKKFYDRAMWGLDRQFPNKGFEYQTCKFLWRVIIFNDPTKNAVFACPRSCLVISI